MKIFDYLTMVTMNNTLRLSLLYLLLIIPQHGNVPISRMESWMEMDQGDGFVDRDLTSSLTGAESFGSAHKNYQNALIRKKQADNEDEGSTDNFSGSFPDRVQRSPMPANLMPNPNYGYNNYIPGNTQNQRAFGLPQNAYQDYRMKLNKNDKSRFLEQGYADVMNPKDVRRRDNKASFDPRMSKCSGSSFEPQAALMELLKFRDGYNGRGLADENEFVTGNEDVLNRAKNEFNEDYAPLNQFGNSEDRFSRYDRDEEDANADESEYYNEERNPAFVRGDIPDIADVDYSQINPHGIIYKREENKGSHSKSSEKGEELVQGSVNVGSKEKALKGSRSDNILEAVAPKESHEITKTDTKSSLQKSEGPWKMNSNLQSKELSDVMRDSQRALEEVQMFQQKLAAKPQYNYANIDWKTDSYLKDRKMGLEEDRRNKREDEDEQKNMKTGTDEGGGEYEDEEGKGHNDEEEYYEEAELSGGKTRSGFGRMNGNLNGKLYKRDAGKDAGRESHNGKEESEVKVYDYELTLENAPVEHEDKSKKSPLQEGMSGKRVVARKGAKIWDHWGKWSPCSVTCGVGRMTRWRHCIGGGCAQGEKEALIKKCTNPAC